MQHQQYRAHLSSLNAYQRHKLLLHDLAVHYGAGQHDGQRSTTVVPKTDEQLLQEVYQYVVVGCCYCGQCCYYEECGLVGNGFVQGYICMYAQWTHICHTVITHTHTCHTCPSHACHTCIS